MFRLGTLLSNYAIKCISNINLRFASNLTPNYYAVLGLEPKASDVKIKSAYYELSKKYHPDKNFGDEAAMKKILEINEAFEVLGNKTEKVKYDETFFPAERKPETKANFIYEHASEFYEPLSTDDRIYRKKSALTGLKYQQYARHSKGVQKRKARHLAEKYRFCRKMSTENFSKMN